MWALCCKGKAKGIIVTPSSLVGNWEKEIGKWLESTLGRSVLLVQGGGSQSGSKVSIYDRECIED